jgi:hypothetical protein
MCELPAVVAADEQPQSRGVLPSQAYMLNFGIFSPADEEGVVTYPMPDILDGTQINPVVSSLFSADFDQASGVLYAVDNASFSLGTIDLDTGDFTPIAPITGASAGTVTGLAWDSATGIWYLTVNSVLYTIDSETAVATLVGDTGVDTVIEIKFDAAGQLYATSISTDSLYAVDKTDASSSLIGPLGYDINFAQGMAYDYSTDIMWAWLYLGGGTVHWATIDLETGAATPVVSYAGDGPEASGAILSGEPIVPVEPVPALPVPALGPIGLGILALMALVFGALRSRRHG